MGAHLDTATGHSRRNSLSSKKWRRGLGRGGAFEHTQSACFAETDRPLPNPLPLLRRERGRNQRWQCRDAPYGGRDWIARLLPERTSDNRFLKPLTEPETCAASNIFDNYENPSALPPTVPE